jgi:hypothetical protein
MPEASADSSPADVSREGSGDASADVSTEAASADALAEASLDAGDDRPGDAPDDLPVKDVFVSDAPACVPLAQPGVCSLVPYSCVPAGMVLGFNPASSCNGPCGVGSFGCEVVVVDAGAIGIECLCGGGRFPTGLTLVRDQDDAAGTSSETGAVLARNAALESAAVHAFEQLARELEWHGAPGALVARARKAARQEAVHARLFRRAAIARGGRMPRLRIQQASSRKRDLEEIALENAVEGCAREVLGAALLAFQSERCADAGLRHIFTRIAADEAQHAELAWEVHAWLQSRLGSEQRAAVSAAHEAFLAACEGQPPPEQANPAVARALGVPSPVEWRTLVAAARSGLRSAFDAVLPAPRPGPRVAWAAVL